MQSSLNIFSRITISHTSDTLNVLLNLLYISRESMNCESMFTKTIISVADETNSHFEVRILSFNIIYDFNKGVLGPFNPRLHRTCTVHDEAKIQNFGGF
jgi:hypothetical protein